MSIVIRNIEELFEQTNIQSDDLIHFRRPSAPGATKDYSIKVESFIELAAQGIIPFTLTTIGTSGEATYDTETRILNIPQYSGGSSGVSESKSIAYSIALG